MLHPPSLKPSDRQLFFHSLVPGCLGVSSGYAVPREEFLDKVPQIIKGWIGDPLGKGSFGITYQHKLRRDQVVKVMFPRRPKDIKYAEREVSFMKSARGVVGMPSLLDELTGKGCQVIVMEKAPGSTLRDLLKHNFRFSRDLVLAIAVKLLRILQQLHDLGITHHDISLGNVLYDRVTGSVNLIDLGLAAWQYEKPKSIGRGTCGFKAPENIKTIPGASCHHEKIDVFGVGCLMFKLLVGCRLVAKEEERENMERFSMDPKKYLMKHTKFAKLSSDYRQLIVMLLEPKQEDRPTAQKALAFITQRTPSARLGGRPTRKVGRGTPFKKELRKLQRSFVARPL